MIATTCYQIITFQNANKHQNLKSILEKEFGDAIGFHNRFQKNQSSIVYDVLKGGSYIQAAINAWGISDLLLRSVDSRLRNKIKSLQTLHDHHIQNICMICLICQKNC